MSRGLRSGGHRLPVAGATAGREDFAAALFRHLFVDDARLDAVAARFGVRLSDWVLPAGPVGGDLWGLIDIGDDALALYVLDCAGSGVEGAFNAFRMNGLMAALDADLRDPGVVLTTLHRHLRPLLPIGQFVTMLYGVIGDGTFVYASAAAPPPIVVVAGGAPDGGARTLVGDGTGLPLGVGDALYQTRTLAFPEAATLLLCTDGLTNAPRTGDRRFGQDGMLELATIAGPSGTTTAAGIIEQVAPALVEAITDDALLLLCRRQGGRRLAPRSPARPLPPVAETALRRTVLVVDDEPMVRKIIVQSLRHLGYATAEAGDGLAALALLQEAEEPFDGILLDKAMPGLNGLEVLRRVRTLPRHADTPMVMLTGDGTPAAREEGLNAGAWYYLTKPLHIPVAAILLEAAIADRNRYRVLRQENDDRALALTRLSIAEFRFRTVEDVRAVASLLGSLCPDPCQAGGGLSELMMNAVEHGNLGISYAEKTRLMLAGGFEAEVARRLAAATEADRHATVEAYRFPDKLDFVIRDLGSGFDWRRYLDFDPARLTDPHGRGIAMARRCAFSELHYRGTGSEVLARIRTVEGDPTGC
jgi:CheY-like chemotaxis protein